MRHYVEELQAMTGSSQMQVKNVETHFKNSHEKRIFKCLCKNESIKRKSKRH